jgi:hypothetical protein
LSFGIDQTSRRDLTATSRAKHRSMRRNDEWCSHTKIDPLSDEQEVMVCSRERYSEDMEDAKELLRRFHGRQQLRLVSNALLG